MKFMKSWLTAVVALGLVACGGETGSVLVSVSGEEAAVEGWPVGDVGFVDGWSMQFETLVVSLDGFALVGDDSETADLEAGPILVDLTGGERVVYELPVVGARRWEDVRYAMTPAREASVDQGDVDPAVRQRMITEGLSLYLEATATRGDETRTLEWGLAVDVENRRCENGDGTAGIVVAAGADNEVQMTLHLDHLFFDSLILDEAEMRFDAMAAVAEPDGSIDLQALGGQRLADLRAVDGEPLLDETGAPLVYDPGSAPLPEPTLLFHVLEATTTVGHFNGEGHCEYVTN